VGGAGGGAGVGAQRRGGLAGLGSGTDPVARPWALVGSASRGRARAETSRLV